ncbi:MAG: iron-sulfur cluster-binding protein [Acidobacteriia bacterium]|nr:iron-sulfur cluster-binding protein [Terriglobia bacterium]
MAEQPINFKEAARRNLAARDLRENLRRATTHSASLRLQAVLGVPEWEDLRAAAHAIKAEAIDHLAEYLEQFETQAIEAGCKVYWAETASQAAEYVVNVCRQRGASLAVKAKSMTSEEIGLNAALDAAGIHPLETDLGEFIIQLAGETPSHITAPALHKSRTQIGKLFSEKLGIKFSDDPKELTRAARAVLREKFLEASIGITGVNFAAADTGSIVLITNEGNGRMCTTLPRTHIALMGIEKVIPRLDDLRVFLKLLARSSTGQKLTSYVTILNGPRRARDADGPDEMHVVILDNGRSRLLTHPHTREALYCIRCGACLNVCPVYQRVGGHTYGWVYPGPIGSVITPELQGISRAQELPFASSLCGNCSAVCPVKIDLHHMLLWLRKSAVDSSLTSRGERWIMKMFTATMKRPVLYHWTRRLGRMAQRILAPRGKGLRVPRWSAGRDFPPLPEKSFHQLWEEGEID